MSNQIENRIVEMEFDNKQFEDGVKESLSTLDKLKKALNFDEAGKNLDLFAKSTKNFDLNGIGNAVEEVGKKFSTLRLLGIHALGNIVDSAMEAGKKIVQTLNAPFNQIKTGGWSRAMNIEEAKFQLEGLKVAWDDIKDDIDFGVKDTAYGLDAAAKAASQLVASGVDFGKTYGAEGNSPMAKALRGISGVAAMTSSSYEEISQVFTKIAGQGRVYAQDLNSFAARGLNAAATLAQQLGVTETEVREMVHKGEIDFAIFSEAMDDAFGEHAKDANKTFIGALNNIKAALSRIGEPFARSVIQNTIPVLNEVRKLINQIKKGMEESGIFDIFESISKMVSDSLTSKIAFLTEDMANRYTGIINIGNAIRNVTEAVMRIILALSDAFHTVFPNAGGFVDILNRVAEGIEAFSERLIIGNEKLYLFRNIMIVVFSILKAFFKILGSLAKVAGVLFNIIFDIAGVLSSILVVVAELVGYGIRLIAQFIETIDLASIFSTMFDKVKSFFSYLKKSANDTTTVFGKIVNGLKNLGMILGAIIAGPLFLLYEGISFIIEGIKNASNPIDFLKNAFVSLGDKVKEFINYLKQIPVVGKVVTFLENVFNKVSDSVSGFIDWFKDLFDKIKSGRGLIDVLKDKIDELKTSLNTGKLTGIKKALASVKTVLLSIAGLVGGTLYKAFLEVKDLIVGFSTASNPFDFLKNKIIDLGKKLADFIRRIKEIPVLGTVINGLETAFLGLGVAILSVITWFKDLYTQVKNGGNIFIILKDQIVALGQSIADSVKTKWSKFLDEHENIKSIVEIISNAFDKAKDKIKEFVKTVKENFRGLKASEIILAAFATMVLVLMWNINELIVALGGLTRKLQTGFFSIFKQGKTKFAKFSLAMTQISGAIGILVAAFYMLKDVPTDKLKEITKSLAILIGLVGGLSILASVLTEVTARWGSKDGLLGFSSNMFTLALGIGVLIGALKLMEFVDLNGIWTRIGILGAIAAGLATIAVIMSKFAPQLTVGGLFMVAFAASILILVKALENLSKLTVLLDYLKEDWHGLVALILGFAAFAAAAGTIGLSSVLGLVGFVLAIKYLLKNTEEIKGALKGTGIGKLLADFAKQLKEDIKKAVNYVKDAYNGLSEFDKKMVAILGLISGATMVGFFFGISKAAKAFKKAAFSMTILLAAVGVFVYAMMKIAEMTQTIDPAAIERIQTILLGIGGFIAVVLGIAALGTESSSTFGKKIKLSRGGMEENLKQIRKLTTSMGFLILAVAALLLVVDAIDPNSLKEAEKILIGIGIFMGVVAISCELINAAMSKGKTGLSSAGVSSFLGITVLIGILIGAFVALMYYFSQVTWNTQTIVAGVLSIVIIAGAIFGLVQILRNLTNKGGLGIAGIMASLGGSVVAIGLLVLLLTKTLKDSELEKAKKIAWSIIGLLGILSLIALGLLFFSKRTKTDQLTKFKTSVGQLMGVLLGLTAIIAILAILEGLLLKDIDAGRMWGHMTALIVTVGLIATLAEVILYFGRGGKIKNFTTNTLKSSSKNLLMLLAVIGVLMVLFVALSGLAYLMKDVDAGRMWGQFTAILVAITALGAMVWGINQIVPTIQTTSVLKFIGLLGILVGIFIAIGLIAVAMKNINTADMSMKFLAVLGVMVILSVFIFLVNEVSASLNVASIGMFELLLAGMAIIFAGLAGVLWLIDKVIPNDMISIVKKAGIVTALMAVLALIMMGVGKIVEYSKSIGSLFVGVALLAIMEALFLALTGIFFLVSKLPAEGLVSKSQAIVLVLTEMVALLGIMSVLFKSPTTAIFAALGEAPLALMVLLFHWLTIIFKTIDGLKTDGIVAKSQAIILVLLELIALNAVLGLLVETGFGVLGFVGDVALAPLVGIFHWLAIIFKTIDGMKTEGIVAKSQAIILVLLELAVMNSIFGILVLFEALGFISSILLIPLVGIFHWLSIIFEKIDGMKVEGLNSKAQSMVLVLLELEGLLAVLGILSPLALIALLGIPGLLAITKAIGDIASGLALLGNISLEHIQGTIDILVDTLWRLIGVGMVGTFAGPGLTALGNGISALSVGIGNAAGNFQIFERVLTSIASGLGTIVAQFQNFFNVVTIGATNASDAISNGFIKTGVALVSTVKYIVNGITEVVHGGASQIKAEVSDASLWGGHFISNFASGMQSNFGLLEGVCAAGASIVKAFWGHTWPLRGPMNDDPLWGIHMMENFIDGMTFKFPDLGLAAEAGAAIVSNKLGLDSLLSGEMFKSGALSISSFTDGMGSEFSDFSSMVDSFVGQIGRLTGAMSVFDSGIGTLSEYRFNTKNQISKLNSDIKKYESNIERVEKYISIHGEKASNTAYIKEQKKAIEDAYWDITMLQKGLDNCTESSGNASQHWRDAAEAAEQLGTGAGGAAKEVEDFASKLEGVLEGQMDIFSKFEEKEAMSKEELLNNMRSQIEGMTKWANNMSALAAKGIDQGLYEKLAMMGPQGAQYVAAFNEMTAEELAQANNLWAQSLVLPNNVAKQVSASFSNIGLNTMLGWKNGVADEAQAVIDLYRTTGEGAVTATADAVGTHSPSTIFYAIAMYCMLGLRDGIKQYMRLPIDALKFVCGQMIDDAKKMLDPQIFYQVGVNLIDGLTAGLKDEEAMKRLIAALEALVASIREFATGPGGADSHSPSKKTAKLGRYLVEGLAVGLKENADIAGEAAESLAADTVETMKETIAEVAKNLLEDDEFTPVITPVLDLTNVTTGAKRLNSLFTTNQAISAMASMNNLQNAQQIDPNNPNASRFGTTFIQNNYSPKALNRMEIYRQTRNQFAQYKEAML